MMKSKKFLALLLVLLMVISAFSGCKKGNDNNNTPTQSGNKVTGTADKTAEPTKINVLCHASWRTDGSKAAFDYVEKKLNVKFEFEGVPDGDAGEQLIFAKISSGEVPDILWWQGASTINVKMGANKFEDLSGIKDWAADYDTKALATPVYTIDGRQIVGPFGDATLFGMCYNKKVFEDNGVAIPKTWDELVASCEVFKKAGVTPVYLSGKDAWTLQIIALDALGKEYAKNSSLIEGMDTNKIKWTDLSIMKQSLDNMKTLVDKGYVQDTYLSDTYADAQSALLDGTCAMYPMATWIQSELVKITDDKTKLENIGIFTIPGKEAGEAATMGTPMGFSVPSAGKNVDIAKKAIAELCSKEAIEAACAVQPGLPFIKGVNGNAIGLQKDASDIINGGKVAVGPADLTKYQKGPLETYIQDMLVGNTDSTGVLKSLNDDFTKQAEDAGDANWK